MAKVKGLSPEDTLRNSLRKKLKEIGTRRTNWWKKEVGWSRVRVLRKEPGLPWYHEVVVHYNLGVDGKTQALCLIDGGDSFCPVCVKVTDLLETGARGDEVRADKLSGSRSYLMNIFDQEDAEAGLQVYKAPESVITELIEYFCDPEFGDFTHPKTGYDVKIKRVGTGKKDTRYTVRLAKNPSVISSGLLRDLKDLTALYPSRDADEVAELLGGESEVFPCFGAEYDEDDQECDECEQVKACRRMMNGESEKPGKRKKKKGSMKASAAARIAAESDETWGD